MTMTDKNPTKNPAAGRGKGKVPAETGAPAGRGKGKVPAETGAPAGRGKGKVPAETGAPAGRGKGKAPAETGAPAGRGKGKAPADTGAPVGRGKGKAPADTGAPVALGKGKVPTDTGTQNPASNRPSLFDLPDDKLSKDDFGQPRRPTKTWAQLTADSKLRRQSQAVVESKTSRTPSAKWQKVRYSIPQIAYRGSISDAILDDVDSAENIVYIRDPIIEDYDVRFAKDISVIRQYLRDSGLEDNYNFMLKELLSLGVLPCNPYTSLVKRTRQFSETFHMRHNTRSLEEIKKHMDNPYMDTGITYIVESTAADNIIGLPGIVRCIDPVTIQRYSRFVTSMIPKVSTFSADDEYSIQAVASLIGQAVFHGTFYEEPTITEVRVEYVVVGPRLDNAIKLFIDSVLSDMNYMVQFSTHIILGLKVPTRMDRTDDGNDIVWQYDFWSLDNVENDDTRFRETLTDAIMHNKFFSCELVLRDELYLDHFYRGRKEYGLNYIRPAEGKNSEILSTFSEAPMMTLYQGFFYEKAHIEAYMTLYLPRGSVIDATFNPENRKRHYRKGMDFGRKLRETLGINILREDRKKVDIDGFLLNGDFDKFGPYGPQVTGPMKSLWQKKVATYHHHSEIFEAAHYVLLLALMERDSYHDELLVQLYRLFHSTAARLVRLLDKNKVIREMILYYLAEGDSSLVNKTFADYRRQMSDLLNSDMHERSSDVHIMSRRIDEKLNKLLEKNDDGVEQSLPLEPNTVMQLRHLNMFCSCMYAQLVEDALHECPLVPEYIRKMQDIFPEISKQVVPKTAEKLHRPDQMRSEVEVPHQATFSYGYEYQAIADQDRQVIDIEMCMARDKAPSTVATESVLLRYALDVHLDEVWSEYLEELLTGRHLPPNPYPKLVSHFRRAAMKMHLCFEDKSVVVKRLVNPGPKLEDPENYIYEIPGCEAHGHISSLSLLDTDAYSTTKRMMKAVQNTTFLQRKGPYKIAMTLAVSGHSPMYGQLDPYLKGLEFHEHCFIKGPDRCETEAISIYASLVYDHLVSVLRKERYPVIGFFVGRSTTRWHSRDIIDKRKSFVADFEQACNNRQPLVLKLCMLVDWQYVPVVKKHLFHYVNADETERIPFYQSNPVSQYQNVFLEKERAAFHFQQGATPDGCNPFTPTNMRLAFNFIHRRVLNEIEKNNWLSVHRWLLTKTLIKRGATTHVVESWRMFHSVAGQLEYVNLLNVTLQELIYYALNEDQWRTDRGEEPNTETIGCLNLKAFGIMLQAYRDKLDVVLKTSVTMAPMMFADMVQDKLKQITVKDRATEQVYVLIQPQSLNLLAQVHQMTSALQDVVAEGVHEISPEAQSAVRSLLAENSSRPVTVERKERHYRMPKITLLASDDILNEWVL